MCAVMCALYVCMSSGGCCSLSSTAAPRGCYTEPFVGRSPTAFSPPWHDNAKLAPAVTDPSHCHVLCPLPRSTSGQQAGRADDRGGAARLRLPALFHVPQAAAEAGGAQGLPGGTYDETIEHCNKAAAAHARVHTLTPGRCFFVSLHAPRLDTPRPSPTPRSTSGSS